MEHKPKHSKVEGRRSSESPLVQEYKSKHKTYFEVIIEIKIIEDSVTRTSKSNDKRSISFEISGKVSISYSHQNKTALECDQVFRNS